MKRAPCKDREAVSARLLKYYSLPENRARRGDIARKARIPDEFVDSPALFYVAERDGKTKTGRVLETGLKRRMSSFHLTVVEAWEMTNLNAQKLELVVHERFGHLRSLDPSFGPGWTEVFDIHPYELIRFIEEEML